ADSIARAEEPEGEKSSTRRRGDAEAQKIPEQRKINISPLLSSFLRLRVSALNSPLLSSFASLRLPCALASNSGLLPEDFLASTLQCLDLRHRQMEDEATGLVAFEVLQRHQRHIGAGADT